MTLGAGFDSRRLHSFYGPFVARPERNPNGRSPSPRRPRVRPLATHRGFGESFRLLAALGELASVGDEGRSLREGEGGALAEVQRVRRQGVGVMDATGHGYEGWPVE